METALQTAIKQLKEIRNKASKEYKGAKTNEDKEEWLSQITGIDYGINAMVLLLPKEREQIERAFTTGEFNNDNDDDGMCISAQEYYETNFNTNKV